MTTEEARRLAREMFAAAVAGVAPGPAVRRSLRSGVRRLEVGDTVLDVEPFERVLLLAVGKAAPAMAEAAADAVAPLGLPFDGLVVAPPGTPPPDTVGVDVVRGSHPLPDADSVTAGQALLARARAADASTLVLCLISGGGSALAEVPAEGLVLDDLAATVSVLLRASVPIGDINTVRRQLSAIKGGRLAAAAHPATVVTLLISDVIGDAPHAIASGPSIPDPTTAADALGVLDRHGLTGEVPNAVRTYLEHAARQVPSPVHDGRRGAVTVVASGRIAAIAAADRARVAGHDATVVATDLSGDAATRGVGVVRARTSAGIDIYAGETTVTVAGDGIGGRNHHAALAAALHLDVTQEPVVFLAAGTDGIDGITAAAGAVVDATTVRRGTERGLDAARTLAEFDTGTYLAAVGDAIHTGPTGTNVGDIWIVIGAD